MLTLEELRQMRAEKIEQAGVILDAAETEDRDLNEDEQTRYDELLSDAETMQRRIDRREAQETRMAQLTQLAQVPAQRMDVPAVNQIPLGDTEERAMAHFVRTGDAGGLETRASNDTDMNVGTDADGGYAVPTGHYNGIIARRDEGMLAGKLGVRQIPGLGTTVNVPLDGEADGEFVSTDEAADFDRDAPVLGTKAMTLVKYTKKVELSVELLQDEDSRLLAFLADFVGRGMAKTHNSLLLTEVGTNGSTWDTFASATAIAAGEPENCVSNDDLSGYMDDAGSVAWVMRSSTHWAIQNITGDSRLYAPQANFSEGPQLLGYPVHYSNKAAAIAGDAKTVYFGNWNFVGIREAPGFTVLRDPYSKAGSGQVCLHYYFRTVYGVLQAEAIGFGDQASA